MSDSTPAPKAEPKKTAKPSKPKKDSIPRHQARHLSQEAILEEAGPSGFAFWSVLTIILLIAAAVTWSYFVTITTAATTEGEVVPSGDVRVVQHLEGGIISEINGRDGDYVRQGDVLIRFDDTLRDAERAQILARQAALGIKEEKLRAFIDSRNPDFSAYAENFPVLVEEARIGLLSTRERIAGQLAVLETRIRQREKSVEMFNKQAASLRQQTGLVKEAVDMRRQLFKSGHGSRVNVINSQLEFSRVQGSLTDAEVSADQALVAIEEARSEIIELEVTERANAMEELSATLAELAEVRENIRRLDDRVNRLEVRAPVTGVIHGQKVNTPGAVVEPADVLLTIVPADEQVVVETRIEPKDIGHIAVGQDVKVTVSGFDVRRYGVVKGRLETISPSTFTDDQGEAYFKGRVILSRDTIRVGETESPIVPGMTVTADIETGTQTLLSYLTRPVYAALVSSFSER
ncbi:MAG: HlyD family type I secretion periplasmic adaptor subunit [Magnetovibrionaceae bacterium]